MKTDVFGPPPSILQPLPHAIEEKLRHMDDGNESMAFVRLAVPHFSELTLDSKLLAIYHAWKCAQLELIRSHVDRASSAVDDEVRSFLLCHETRVRGNIRESFELLEKLAQKCKAQIVQYRYVAEFIAFNNLHLALPLMEELLPCLPRDRKLTIQFNYGITATNQSNFPLAENILNIFAQSDDQLSHLYFHWLSGSYWDKKGCFQKSMDHYLIALNSSKIIPSRSTDVGIIACNLLQMAFWVGDLEKARLAYTHIEKASRESAGVGVNRFMLSTAMLEFMEGQVISAVGRLDVLYGEEKWTREHLPGSFVYLWALTATGKHQQIIATVKKLEILRDSLAQSKQQYDFELFVIYSRSLAKETGELQTYQDILRYSQSRSHTQHSFHLDWANGLALLFQEQPFEKLHAVTYFKAYPLLQRTIVWILAHNPAFEAPIYWRYITSQSSDFIAHAMSQYRLSQLTQDLVVFVSSVKRLIDLGALTWLISMETKYSPFKYEISHQIVGSAFVLDYDSRRVVATTSGETLDAQPQLAELFLSIASSRHGQDKEHIALGLGFKSYDPSQHDPPIYNLIARLRDWLRKQDLHAEIVHTQNGWKLSFFDRLVIIHASAKTPGAAGNADPHFPSPKTRLPPSHLPPRLSWICEELGKRNTLTRSDLMKQFNIKKTAAADDFNFLIMRGFIVRHGAGRGIFYKLAQRDHS